MGGINSVSHRKFRRYDNLMLALAIIGVMVSITSIIISIIPSIYIGKTWIFKILPLIIIVIIFILYWKFRKEKSEIEKNLKNISANQIAEKSYPDQESALIDIRDSLNKCENKVKILIARGSSHFGQRPSVTKIREQLTDKKANVKIEILMILPDSGFLEERQRETGLLGKEEDTRETYDKYNKAVKASITEVIELCKVKSNFELGLYDEKIIWRYFIFDDVLFLGTYPPLEVGVDGGENAFIIKIRKDRNESSKQLYLAFERFFDFLMKRFKTSQNLKTQLCMTCKDLDYKSVQSFVENYDQNVRRKIGGCYGCEKQD